MTEKEIVEAYLKYSDCDSSCACGQAYIGGIWIKAHCHRSNDGCKCKYGGIHIGKDWDSNLNIKKIGEMLRQRLTKQWDTEFRIVYLPDGRPTFLSEITQ